MGFEQITLDNFAPARDFFWLAIFFLGAGTGCILNCFRKKAKIRFRNWTVTAGFCFFSLSVAALTAAAIYSNWMIFKETGLYLPMGIFAVIVTIAFRFPRAAGFPLFIITGFLTIAMGYICIRIPAIDNSGRIHVARDGNDLIRILQVIQSDDAVSSRSLSTGTNNSISLSFQADDKDTVLEFRAVCFDCSKVIPFMGGVRRGIITEILKANELLYKKSFLWKGFRRMPDAGANNKIIRIRERFFTVWETTEKFDISGLHPGTGVTVLFDGPELAFR